MGNQTAVSNIVQVDTGWQPTAVTTLQQNGGGSPGISLYSEGTVRTQAQFGRLRILGTGQAQNWNGNGTSLYVNMSASDLPTVQFRDTLTVQAPGLPAGTPVQLRLRVRMAGSCVLAGLMPLVSNYSAQIRVAPEASSLGVSSVVASLDSTTGVATAIVPTAVGQTFVVEGRTTCNVDEYGVRNGFPVATASYSIDLESLFDFTSLTPGASIATCSGVTYPSLQASSQPVGTGCGAAPPTLVSTLPRLGTTLLLTTNGAPAQAPVFRGFAVGAPAWLPFGTCTLQLDPASLQLDFAGFADAAGRQTVALPLPGSSSLAGLAVTAQTLMPATNGPFLGFGELSNGVALVVGL
ncbi:MAG: hypothetical protein IPM29_07190 [Planctomycetes bacterium]|nr:hypothetical protein [Planctomycetota bacterium]